MMIKSYFSTFFLACVFFILLNLSPLQAQTSAEHTVKSGDTLFKIADQHNVSVQQLKEWNSLSSSQLSIGQVLQIKKKAESPKSGTTHTVQPKETLYSISKKYGVSIADLKKWNNVQGQDLAVGAQLTIHPGKSEAAASTGSSTQAPQSTYNVKSGDSLFRIARIHNMTVERLKQINNLSSNNIQVGQQLAVRPTDQPPSLTVAGVETSSQGKFVRYTVDERQKLSELLASFRMSPTEFEALNPGLRDTTFRRGQELTLLAPAGESFKNPYAVENSLRSIGTARVTPYKNQDIEPTTSGELYNPQALTAAHSNIAMGSVIFVENKTSGRGVLVRINDRTAGSSLKLSQAAWNALALSSQSTVTMFSADE